MNFTFPQNYYIWQLLSMGHDCSVPVDKHDSVQNTLLDPLGEVKGQLFAVCNN